LMVMNSPPRGLDSPAIFTERPAIRKRHDVPVTERNPYFRTCVRSDTVVAIGRLENDQSRLRKDCPATPAPNRMNGERGTYAFPAARFRSNKVNPAKTDSDRRPNRTVAIATVPGFGAIQSKIASQVYFPSDPFAGSTVFSRRFER
jgi:hypothetical protein